MDEEGGTQTRQEGAGTREGCLGREGEDTPEEEGKACNRKGVADCLAEGRRKSAHGEERSQQQLPGAHRGQVEGRIWGVRHSPDGESEGEEDGRGREDDRVSSGPDQEDEEKRKDEVELLLHCERPGMKQGHLFGGTREVAGLLPEEDVRGEERGGGHTLAEALQLVG